jgi:HK97 family phage prohead protease
MRPPQHPESPPPEIRTTARPVEVRATGARRVIGGYGATFGGRSQNLGGFREVVSDKAFNKSAGDGWPGAICRYNHLDEMLLGTTQARTLRLAIDSTGLFYEVDLPESRSDTYELVQRGDVSASSFAFECWDDSWGFEDGVALRTLLSVRLLDVAPVTRAAYPDATVGLRSLARYMDAPIEDVVKRAERDELRAFFVRTGSPRVETRGRRPEECLAELAAKRHPDGSPRVTKPTPQQRLIELMRHGKYGPPPTTPKDGRLAWIETMGRRFGPGEL